MVNHERRPRVGGGKEKRLIRRGNMFDGSGVKQAVLMPEPEMPSGFFFFIFKKIKISKIYVCFEIFQKYTPVALP